MPLSRVVSAALALGVILLAPVSSLAQSGRTRQFAVERMASAEEPTAEPPLATENDHQESFAAELQPQPCWVEAEYLLWWLRNPRLPPLVTASAPGVPFGSATVLNQPGTHLLFGGDNLGLNHFHGARFTLGNWWTCECEVGGEVSFFFLPEQRNSFLAASDGAGNPALGVPFVSTLDNNTEAALLVSFPGPPFSSATGSIQVDHTTELWGLEANLIGAIDSRADCLPMITAGFRYLDLHESLNLTASTTFLPGGGTAFTNPATNVTDLVLPPNGVVIHDGFDTRNQFYGGQLGVRWHCHGLRWSLNADLKVALGATHQTVNVQGSSSLVTPAGVAATVPGGLFALPSNSGRHTRDVLTVVPEVNLKLGYQLTPRLGLFVGYNFLFWGEVLRPGDQVDRAINVSQQPTSLRFGENTTELRPAPRLQSSDLWLQGVNVGVSFSF